MKSKNYPLYVLAIASSAAVALWAGMPAPFLLIVLVCPVMMFFMMRGMHGDQNGHEGHGGHEATRSGDVDAHNRARAASPLDGSHERIDRP